MTEHSWATFREYNRLQEGVERWQRCECGAARRLLIRNGEARILWAATQTRCPNVEQMFITCLETGHNCYFGLT